MRKKLLGGLLVISIAAVATFNMSFNTQENELSLLALANVEALANGESGTGNTVDWSGYNFFTNSQKYKHIQKVIQGSGKEAHELLPHVHMVDSLVKRWINGTHQGKISPKHLPYYLDEFAFRFNRKRSTYREKLFYRLMQQVVETPPVPFKDIINHLGRKG